MKFPYNRILEIKTRYKNGELPREEAKEQLAYVLELGNDYCEEVVPEHIQVNQSYGPLVRLSDVCNTLTLWAKIFSQELPTDSDYKKEERKKFAEYWSFISIAIQKSNLLARLFFDYENVRTEPCPDHKGKWSGCFGEGPNGPCICQTGGNVTGWLPESPELADFTYWNSETKSYRVRSEDDPKSPRVL